MTTGTILRLNDKLNVKVIDNFIFDNKDYYFCNKLDENEKELDGYLFFEYNKYENSEIMKLVNDEQTIENLLVVFTGKLTSDIENEARV